MRLAPYCITLLLLAPHGAAQKQDPEDKRHQELVKRIEELEALTADLEERQGSTGPVHSFSALKLHLGGHLTSVFSHMRGEDSSDTGHIATLIELFVNAELSDRLRVFATPGFVHFTPPVYVNTRAPSLSHDDGSYFDGLLARAFGEYRHSAMINIQAGIIGTPHGVTNREYFIPSRMTMSSNLHTRVFLDNMLYAQRLIGTKISGQQLLGDQGNMAFDYDLYAGVETNDPNGGEYGARTALTWTPLNLTAAANYGRGARESYADLTGNPTAFNVPLLLSPFPSTSNTRNSYEFAGLDLDWRGERGSLRLETYRSWEEGQEDRKAFSFMPGFRLREDIGLSYRFDYFDAGQGLGHATEHTLGIFYDYTPQARLRLDFAHQELPRSPDAVDYLVLSFSLSF